MNLFNLHNIVNQENQQCSNNVAYNIYSQTNAGTYNINDEMGDLCNCTMNDAIGDPINGTNLQCPPGQSVGTYFPLLNKVECCSTCEVKPDNQPNNLPSNYDHIANKLYPVTYDFTMFYENPHFVEQVNDGKISKTSPEQIDTRAPGVCALNKIHDNKMEPFADLSPIISDHDTTNNQIVPVQQNIEVLCMAYSFGKGLNYIIIFCTLMMIILGGIIYCKKKNIV